MVFTQFLGKPKRRFGSDIAVHGGPCPLHTTYPLSKEAFGQASPLFFSEILEAKFSKIFSSSHRPSWQGRISAGKAQPIFSLN
jgi:hypothetical protein